MPKFSFEAVDSVTGETIRKWIEAPSEDAAADEIRSRGYMVVRIALKDKPLRPASSTSPPNATHASKSQRVIDKLVLLSALIGATTFLLVAMSIGAVVFALNSKDPEFAIVGFMFGMIPGAAIAYLSTAVIDWMVQMLSTQCEILQATRDLRTGRSASTECG